MAIETRLSKAASPRGQGLAVQLWLLRQWPGYLLGRVLSRRFTGSAFRRHEFTAVFEKDQEWVIAYCPEVPGANGQGRTKDEARRSLAEGIALVLEDRRDDGLRGVPDDAERETILVEIPGAA